jgi:hypothetical protein
MQIVLRALPNQKIVYCLLITLVSSINHITMFILAKHFKTYVHDNVQCNNRIEKKTYAKLHYNFRLG